MNPHAEKTVQSFLDDGISLEHFLLEWNTWDPEDQHGAFTKVATTDEVKCIQIHPHMKRRIVEIVDAKWAAQKRNSFTHKAQ